jgi:dimethylaniline monooxygenase (N-oxide forming)
MSLPKTCVIGAGSSGIAACKALHEKGVPFDCFEASDRVGGNWVFGNSNGMSAAYEGLHINTSRDRMEYSDFPMPKAYPDYPHHEQIAAYFDDYVDHFGFREQIRFSTPVRHAARSEQGTWAITLEGGEERRYDALIVANGHHWNPRMPEPAFPGHDTTNIEQLHAHAYLSDEQLRGKEVVVLGMGNSAMDIAVESSYVARRTWLSARSGVWVTPKYLLGRPTDQIKNDIRIPFRVRRWALEKLILSSVGAMEKYGLPKPDHRYGEAHPTVSGRILDRIGHGKVTPRPNIARLHEHEVEFTDGTRVPCDIVVYCTGYRITFPFFDAGFISAPENRIELFRRVHHPEIPNVFFVGLLQPLGAVMPLAEAQGAWVADTLRGDYLPPSGAEQRADIAADLAAMAKRYVSSKRHTIQVDFDEYLADVAKERRAGAQRARAAGFPLPVEPRVGTEAAA